MFRSAFAGRARKNAKSRYLSARSDVSERLASHLNEIKVFVDVLSRQFEILIKFEVDGRLFGWRVVDDVAGFLEFN